MDVSIYFHDLQTVKSSTYTPLDILLAMSQILNNKGINTLPGCINHNLWGRPIKFIYNELLRLSTIEGLIETYNLHNYPYDQMPKSWGRTITILKSIYDKQK